ncbi:hypothetical protein GQ457_08G017200 [Hibiscus cannabinus]
MALKPYENMAWILGGDCDAIIRASERLCGSSRQNNICRCFGDFILDVKLNDLGFNGPCFTWKRVNFQQRLDRWLGNDEWVWGPNADLSSNMGNFQITASKWNMDVFGNIGRLKARLMARIKVIKRVVEFSTDSRLQDLDVKLKQELDMVLSQEEYLWFQRSRSQWIKDRDRNTKYYHRVTKARNQRNTFAMMKLEDGQWCANPDLLRKGMVCFFQALFESDYANILPWTDRKMSNLGDNFISSSPTPVSPQLPTEGSPISSFEGTTQPSLSQPNVLVDNNESSEYNPSKLKSVVWEHFKKEKINNEWKAICNYCNRKLGGNSKNGTKHLHDHLARCNKRGQVDIRQRVLIANKKKSGWKIGPMFNMPSRNTIKKDILDMFEKEKEKTLSKLEANKGRIAITTDMWTADHQNRGYMAVTAHYIDDEWTLQKRIIRFEYVPTPHTSDVIAKQKKAKVVSELDCYLEEDVIPRTPNFNILVWWKINGPQIPILKAIAKDIYAIPVSTVASESTFSTGGRLMNPQRNRLHPSTVEALTCCQNWLWAEKESMSNETKSFNEDDDEASSIIG